MHSRMASVGLLAQSLEQWAPRWARDSAARAARMSGIATQTTGSINLDMLRFPEGLSTSETTPGPAVERATALASPAAPQPATVSQRGLRTRNLIVALIAAGACAVLAAGAWRINHAPRFKGGGRGGVSIGWPRPPLVQTVGDSRCAAAPALPLGRDDAPPW